MLFLTADCRRTTFLFVHHGFEVGAALQLECVSSEWWRPKTVEERRGGCVGRWRCQASVVRAIWASGIKSEIPFQFQFKTVISTGESIAQAFGNEKERGLIFARMPVSPRRMRDSRVQEHPNRANSTYIDEFGPGGRTVGHPRHIWRARVSSSDASPLKTGPEPLFSLPSVSLPICLSPSPRSPRPPPTTALLPRRDLHCSFSVLSSHLAARRPPPLH